MSGRIYAVIWRGDTGARLAGGTGTHLTVMLSTLSPLS